MPPLPTLPPLPPRCDADALGRAAALALLAPQLEAAARRELHAALVADARRAYPRNSSPGWIRANAMVDAFADAFEDAFAEAFVEAYFAALVAGEVAP